MRRVFLNTTKIFLELPFLLYFEYLWYIYWVFVLLFVLNNHYWCPTAFHTQHSMLLCNQSFVHFSPFPHTTDDHPLSLYTIEPFPNKCRFWPSSHMTETTLHRTVHDVVTSDGHLVGMCLLLHCLWLYTVRYMDSPNGGMQQCSTHLSLGNYGMCTQNYRLFPDS